MKHTLFTCAALLMTQMAMAQGIVITGHVGEAEGDVIGGSIIEQDKNGRIISSTVTDLNGNFSLSIKNPENQLKVPMWVTRPSLPASKISDALTSRWWMIAILFKKCKSQRRDCTMMVPS